MFPFSPVTDNIPQERTAETQAKCVQVVVFGSSLVGSSLARYQTDHISSFSDPARSFLTPSFIRLPTIPMLAQGYFRSN